MPKIDHIRALLEGSVAWMIRVLPPLYSQPPKTRRNAYPLAEEREEIGALMLLLFVEVCA